MGKKFSIILLNYILNFSPDQMAVSPDVQMPHMFDSPRSSPDSKTGRNQIKEYKINKRINNKTPVTKTPQ